MKSYSRIFKVSIVYALVGAMAVVVGYLSVRQAPILSPIRIAGEVPETKPDAEWLVNLFGESQPYLVNSIGLALITEDSKDTAMNTRFWCPREPDSWGEVVYRFPIDSNMEIKQVVLDVNLCTFPMFDPSTVAELAISTTTKPTDKWRKLVVLDGRVSDRVFKDPIDITEWVRGSNIVYIKYRLRARRMQFHPTPNDPVGYAGAQCLRQLKKERCSMAMRVWFESDHAGK